MNAPLNERSPKWALPQMNIWKIPLENGRFRTQNMNKIGQKSYCEIDQYVGKVFWAKKSAQLVIPVRSTFKNDLHPPIGGPHRQLDLI